MTDKTPDPISEAIAAKRIELKAVLDDDYRGLRRTSNTNKSRMEILALFDEVAAHLIRTTQPTI